MRAPRVSSKRLFPKLANCTLRYALLLIVILRVEVADADADVTLASRLLKVFFGEFSICPAEPNFQADCLGQLTGRA